MPKLTRFSSEARLAFIGDIHGRIDMVTSLLASFDAESRLLVPLGDYINKGPNSCEVIELILELESSGRAIPIRGNHEQALLDMIDGGRMGPFLKMGGAATIRSYVGGPVKADVLPHFLQFFPRTHMELLRRMPDRLETPDLIAAHEIKSGSSKLFTISAHIPVGKFPRIDKGHAEIDTGCGGKDGRLSALLWPELTVVQSPAAS